MKSLFQKDSNVLTLVQVETRLTTSEQYMKCSSDAVNSVSRQACHIDPR